MEKLTQQQLDDMIQAHLEDGTRIEIVGRDARNLNLADLDLSGADLRFSDFSGCDMEGTVLTDADLLGSQF